MDMRRYKVSASFAGAIYMEWIPDKAIIVAIAADRIRLVFGSSVNACGSGNGLVR